MRYFFGFLAAIGLIILVFILIVRGFSGGSKEQQAIDLSSYGNTGAVVRLTVDGPVVADQEHNAYQITIGRDTAQIETYKGYERQVIETKAYDNNQESFETFLLALQRAGYTRNAEEKTATDPRGMCPSGNRYTYELVDGSATVVESWSASCNKGTFRGNATNVRTLFMRQIPDFSKVTGKLNL